MSISRRSEGETMRAVIFATIASLLAAGTLQAEDTAPAERGRAEEVRWPLLSEQFFRVEKWSVCRG
jgi:hypothetical protein